VSLEDFLNEPWKNSHRAYEDAFFNVRPAPEYANSEVLLASLYRASGFGSHGESDVPAAGKAFEKAIQARSRSIKSQGHVSLDTWLTVVHGVLESPKLPNQSSKRFLQLCPIVPEVALYSGSARTSGKSWNPGQLIERMVWLGAPDGASAELLWRRLHEALTIASNDDIWARWLHSEFQRRATSSEKWTYIPLANEVGLPPEDKLRFEFPAKQFVRDLDAIVSAKDRMTRRQWISLLEAILRLGAVTHVLWLCHVNSQLWSLAHDVLAGAEVPSISEIGTRLFKRDTSFVVYGNPSIPIIRDFSSRYLVARIGINLLLWRLDGLGEKLGAVASLADVENFLSLLAAKSGELKSPSAIDQINVLHDQHPRALACKKGIGSNLVEFGRHALGQRQTANEILRGYDQGYVLRKGGQYSSAPWVVSLGPVAVLALVHCCLNEVSGPRSVRRLSMHLARYGLSINENDIAQSDLGQKLRMLGLVLDSPDAESGMLLISPFGRGAAAAELVKS